MRLISKFHDYYDCISRSDLDNHIIYNRVSKNISIKIPSIKNNKSFYDAKSDQFNYVFNSLDNDKKDTTAETFIVGFCGKLYNGLRVQHETPYKVSYYYEKEAYRYIVDNFNKNDSRYYVSFYKDNNNIIDRLKGFKTNSDLKNIFLEYRSPCFLAKSQYGSKYPTIELNCCLKDIEFFKVFQVDQAYQEIRMFVENQLAQDTQVVVPVGSDVVIAESKGYDKYSFRKDKQKV